MMQQQTKYKKINIQNLQKRPQPERITPTKQQIVQQMNSHFQWGSYPFQCYLDSGISKERIIAQNGLFRANNFFQAFYIAYTKHGNIVLVPDQVWIMILFYLSKYIDQNAERLRKKFVLHQGIKTLTVLQISPDPQTSLMQQKNWDYFFEEIIKQIQQSTVQGVVESFSCNFSTTNKIYKTISTAIVMNSLKKYFNYHRMLAGCGINNVYMAGNRQDWAKMIPKLQNMVKYDVDGKLKKYIQHMKKILKNFLLTFEQKPDVSWWNTIMTTYQKRQQYGGDQIQIQGWILNFFGQYQRRTFDGFPQFTVKLPIKLTNTLTKKQKSLLLVSDWVSVSKLDQRTYKPDVGMCIFTIREGPIKQDRVEKDINQYKERMKLKQQFLKMNHLHIMFPFDEQNRNKNVSNMKGKTVPKKLVSKKLNPEQNKILNKF